MFTHMQFYGKMLIYKICSNIKKQQNENIETNDIFIQPDIISKSEKLTLSYGYFLFLFLYFDILILPSMMSSRIVPLLHFIIFCFRL